MISSIGSYTSYMNCMQTEKAKPDPADMFNKIDSDGSGGVSQSELETFLENISSKTGNTIDTTDAVSTYDSDGSGELSDYELKSFMEASGIAPPPAPGGKGMMEETSDADESSTTTAESVLSAYDANNDGMLNSDELQGYLDDNSNTSSFTKLIEQAISAYVTNFGNTEFSDMGDSFWTFGGLNGYSSVNFSV